MDFDLYSASPVYWPLKELYNTHDSHTDIHTLMAEAAHHQQYVAQYLPQGHFNRYEESKQTGRRTFFALFLE